MAILNTVIGFAFIFSLFSLLLFSGPDNLVNLKKIAQQYQRQEAAGAAEEDDDVPELVEGETFEDADKQEAETA